MRVESLSFSSPPSYWPLDYPTNWWRNQRLTGWRCIRKCGRWDMETDSADGWMQKSWTEMCWCDEKRTMKKLWHSTTKTMRVVYHVCGQVDVSKTIFNGSLCRRKCTPAAFILHSKEREEIVGRYIHSYARYIDAPGLYRMRRCIRRQAKRGVFGYQVTPGGWGCRQNGEKILERKKKEKQPVPSVGATRK